MERKFYSNHGKTSAVIKKTIFFFLWISFLGLSKVPAQESGKPVPDDPMRQLIQNSMAKNALILAQHKEVMNYFNQFLSLWDDFLEKFLSENRETLNLETLFSKNYELAKKTAPVLEKLKAPSDFKEFQDTLTKGLDDLSDFSFDLQNRIHYAKTNYQKDAYMKRVEGFRSQGYDTFFGTALEELTNDWSIFSTRNWFLNLTPDQQKALRRNLAVHRYLSDFQKINVHYFNGVESVAKKARESKNSGDDPETIVENLKKELNEFQTAQRALKKLKSPEACTDLHGSEMAWYESSAKEIEKLIELETAYGNHAPTDQIQTLIYEKTELDEETAKLREKVNSDYASILSALTEQSTLSPAKNPRQADQQH